MSIHPNTFESLVFDWTLACSGTPNPGWLMDCFMAANLDWFGGHEMHDFAEGSFEATKAKVGAFEMAISKNVDAELELIFGDSSKLVIRFDAEGAFETLYIRYWTTREIAACKLAEDLFRKLLAPHAEYENIQLVDVHATGPRDQDDLWLKAYLVGGHKAPVYLAMDMFYREGTMVPGNIYLPTGYPAEEVCFEPTHRRYPNLVN